MAQIQQFDQRARRRLLAELGGIVIVIFASVVANFLSLEANDDPPPRPSFQQQARAMENKNPKPEILNGISWGEPSNNFRAAVVVRRAPESDDANDLDFFLAVQKASNDFVYLHSLKEFPLTFELKIKLGDVTEYVIRTDSNMFEDDDEWQLDESCLKFGVTLIRVLPPNMETVDGRLIRKKLLQDLFENPQRTIIVDVTRNQAPESQWTGTLVTGRFNGTMARCPQPKYVPAHQIYIDWQEHARLNGDLPGGLLERLKFHVESFAAIDPSRQSLVEKMDTGRDWKPEELVSLFDELAAVDEAPFIRAQEEEYFKIGEEHRISFRRGVPLPPELADSQWGLPERNGLRAALRLEPFAKDLRLGTVLDARMLIHNMGYETVIFRTPNFVNPNADIKDVAGKSIAGDQINWLGRKKYVTFRLAPGEYIELAMDKVVIGSMDEFRDDDRRFDRIGSWIDAHPGETLIMTPSALIMMANVNAEIRDPKAGPADEIPAWWLKWIDECLSRELPLPGPPEERTRILNRVTRCLFGTAPTAKETDQFVTDSSPNAVELLKQRLKKRQGLRAISGELQPGAVRFRVLPKDPEEGKRPRSASRPGRYRMSKELWFVVNREKVGDGSVINEAVIQFGSRDDNDQDGALRILKHRIKLPDEGDPWTSAWISDSQELWVLNKDFATKCDFSDPNQIKETTIDRAQVRKQVPLAILKAMHKEGPFDILELPR